MTQPVQEPSQGRTDQAQEFRTRQLFRRPGPAASAGGSGEEFAFYKAVGVDLEGDPMVPQILGFDGWPNAYYSDFPATFEQEDDGIRILRSGLYRTDAMTMQWPDDADPLDRFYAFYADFPDRVFTLLMSNNVGYISGSQMCYQSRDIFQFGEDGFTEQVLKLYVEISVDYESIESGFRSLVVTRIGDQSETVGGWEP